MIKNITVKHWAFVIIVLLFLTTIGSATVIVEENTLSTEKQNPGLAFTEQSTEKNTQSEKQEKPVPSNTDPDVNNNNPETDLCKTSKPINPTPEDNAVNVPVLVTFIWDVITTSNVCSKLSYDIILASDTMVSKIASDLTEKKFTVKTPLKYNTRYQWMVIIHNGCEDIDGDYWSFTTEKQTNTPPYVPSNPTPKNGTENVTIKPVLSWTGGDPDPQDTVTYDVFIADQNSVILHSIHGIEISEYVPPQLECSTFYVWWVVATDNDGATTQGPFWYFTTEAAPSGDDDDDDDVTEPTGPSPGSWSPPPIVLHEPIADMTNGEPYQSLVGETIHFDGSLSSDTDGTIVKYSWDFGDNTIGDEQKVDHIYSSEGIFTVTLTVTDDDDLIGVATGEAIINVPNQPPEKPILDAPLEGDNKTNHTLVFYAVDPNGDDLSYIIDWGDGEQITSPYFIQNRPILTFHMYEKTGIYDITVYAKDREMAVSPVEKIQVYIGIHTHLINDEITGYLLDYYPINLFESFYNPETGEQLPVSQDDQGIYLIDSDGDGIFDYTYDLETQTLTAHQQTILSEQNIYTLIALIAIAILLFFLIQNKGLRAGTLTMLQKMSPKRIHIHLRQNNSLKQKRA